MRVSYSIALSTSSQCHLRRDITFRKPLYTPGLFSNISQTKDNTIRIRRLTDTLSLKYLLTIPYKKEKGYYTASYCIGSFVIASAERTYSEMAKDIKEQISYAWEYYALEDDDMLADSAKQVKKWLLENVIEAQ